MPLDFDLSPEQQLLRDTAREFLARPYDPAQWQAAQQLGWADLGQPGVDGGLLEAVLVAVEIGRALWRAPFVEAVARGRCEVGALLTAAQLVGVGEVAMELTLDHVKRRHQFGRPIGAFQAARHRLAELSAELDMTRALVFKAAWVADRGENAQLLISQAKLSACRTAYQVLTGSHQLHGGVGFAADHRLPRYTLARLELEGRYGDAEYHLTRIQELLDLV
jgi:alkylation response protein AidB-like acyl-CoA dehydrogenase